MSLLGKAARWYGDQLKKSVQKGRELTAGPKCPYCGSTNNNVENPINNYLDGSVRASKKFGVGLVLPPAALLVGNKKKPDGVLVGECFDCGKKWRLG